MQTEMGRPQILWADDEIELLKPHILFLNEKGYDVTGVNSGVEALDEVEAKPFDVVFLDENMPGLNGIETLQRIKTRHPDVPVIMITKSEEEHIMEEAIGSKISDYLIKPVNPNQILLAVKKILDNRRLRGEQAQSTYMREFRELAMKLGGRLNAEEWSEVYRRLMHWHTTLGESEDRSMLEILENQHAEANHQFVRFVEDHYEAWMTGLEQAPMMSHRVLPEWLPPAVEGADGRPVFLVVIDNLRWDQWRTIAPTLRPKWNVVEEKTYFSILPTATQYARNALFAGMTPGDIARMMPNLWIGEHEQGSKNAHEETLQQGLFSRLGVSGKTSYHKITNLQAGKRLADRFHELKGQSVITVVYNFVDMLSHARSEMEVIKELADDEAAYRSLTHSWFQHSPLKEMMDAMADMGGRLILTTDHGTMRVDHPVEVRGDRETNSNLRYKVGKNLGYNADEVMEIRNPERAGLPKPNVSSSYIFGKGKDFLVYPNNAAKYTQTFRDTFQHGGVSMEEMIVPWVILDPKRS